jgi:hypothetical protein
MNAENPSPQSENLFAAPQTIDFRNVEKKNTPNDILLRLQFEKNIKGMRIVLCGIGILAFYFNLAFYLDSKSLPPVPTTEIQTGRFSSGQNAIQATIQVCARPYIAMGVIFIVLGICVYRDPVLISAIALMLYFAVEAGLIVIYPWTLLQDMLLPKLLVIPLLLYCNSVARRFKRKEAEIMSIDF